MTERFKWDVIPKALPENMVSGKQYRFTVLTERLIRLEYSKNGIFEDRASQGIFYRNFAQTKYSVEMKDGVVTLRTAELEVVYCENAEFSAETLHIRLLHEPASVWNFGEEFETLGGTYKTLDTIAGEIPLEHGLVSRWGFSVVDDSDSLLLGDDGWVEVREKDTKDIYFFGYGYHYDACIRDYYRLTGMPSMLPAYAFGNWWSRYYRYSDKEYLSLMEEFQKRDIPFSVGVVDMDWHTTDIPEEKKEKVHPEKDTFQIMGAPGWTGYSWNKELFPDYEGFLHTLHENYHIKTALNLHPASGVLPHEDMYEEMCRKMGQDANEQRRVPFDILSKKFAENYFDVLHHPYEEKGVDFWWMDWQQGTNYAWLHTPNYGDTYQDERERMDPLWMLNHLHTLDIMRDGRRPMFFSRFSGVGSHRYSIGFSGDTTATWESLAFQPEFTATATNIGYSRWSHDIGGHTSGYKDEELYIRWLQFGVLSPINRLHSTENLFMRKEPWCFSDEICKIASDWLRLRHRLFPYIYTMNYRMAKKGDSFIRPLYYEYPKCDAAYHYPNQYFFGTELMVAPITTPTSKKGKVGSVKAWLPQGDWFDFFNGLHYHCDKNRKMELCRDNKTIPALAKAGAIVPLYEYEKHDNVLAPQKEVTLLVFPGANGEFILYEDAGDGNEYLQDEYVLTKFTYQDRGQEAVFVVHPSRGALGLIPKERHYRIGLRGFHRLIEVAVRVNGLYMKVQTEYDKEHNTTWIVVEADPSDRIEILINGESLIHDNADVKERILDLLTKSDMEYDKKNTMYKTRISNEGLSIHGRMFPLAVEQPENQPLVKAVLELLTLTEEEFVLGRDFAERYY